MVYYSDPGLSDLYNWALRTGVCAGILFVVAALAFIWSLLRSRKVWWLSGIFLFLLGMGCWSLMVALNGFQQLSAFGDRLFQGRHSLTEEYVRFVLGTAYGEDVQRCQIQFGITVTLLAILTIIGLWWLLSHLTKRNMKPARILLDGKANQ